MLRPYFYAMQVKTRIRLIYELLVKSFLVYAGFIAAANRLLKSAAINTS